MTRNEQIKINLTTPKKIKFKGLAGTSSLSKYVRETILGSESSEKDNKEVKRAKTKSVPDINRSFYVELSRISTQLKKLGNDSSSLNDADRAVLEKIQGQIARLGLMAIGITEKDDLIGDCESK